MPLAARERALQAEMRTEGNLHPALFPPSDDPSSLLGHYKVTECPGRCPAEN